MFGRREVAVKRYLKAMFDKTAKNEADCLIASDDHPNIIQYFWMEESIDFVFLALRLCQTNLELWVDGKCKDITVNKETISTFSRNILPF